MKYGIIYCATNLINGKFYIGQTTQTLNKRKNNHKSRKEESSYFHNALNKYGFESFKWEIIDEATNINDLNLMEEEYIILYNTMWPNGYNLTSGGDSQIPSKEVKLKISNSLKGKYCGSKNPFYGKKHSKESRKKIKENHADFSKENHPMFGKKHSKETIQKIKNNRPDHRGNNNPASLKLDDNEIIRLYTKEKLSSHKIAKIMNCSKTTILRHLKNNGIKRRKKR